MDAERVCQNDKMRSRWVVLQHVEWEGPGIIAREAEKRGCEVDIRRLDRGDEIPTADHVDGLVVMGGPWGAYEEDQHPFLRKECELLTAVTRRGVPVLGVCLGAQLLARALGAKVYPGHGAEIGFGLIELAEAGREDSLLTGLGEHLPAFHWHGDTFTLPDGAVLLASSPMYAHQAFRFGSRAYGFQFHIEPDTDTWTAWRDHLPNVLIDEAETQKMRVKEAGQEVISRLFDLALNTAEIAER
jgi:GMP synthase (glutamine-hydrolysing)